MLPVAVVLLIHPEPQHLYRPVVSMVVDYTQIITYLYSQGAC